VENARLISWVNSRPPLTVNTISWLHLPTEDGIHERLVDSWGHTIPAIGPRGTGNFQLSCRDRFHRTLGFTGLVWHLLFLIPEMMSSDRSLDAVGGSTPSRLFWIACVMENQTAWVFLAGASGYWACPALPVPKAESLDISRNCPWDSEQFGAALIPRCISLLCLKSCRLAASKFFLYASEIGEACLISPSAVLGVDSPHRRLFPFQYTGPDCFLQTGYLPDLADSVRALTALFQVNLLALARSHSGVGDFHRALLLGSLFRCWVGIRPSSWPPSFIWLGLL